MKLCDIQQYHIPICMDIQTFHYPLYLELLTLLTYLKTETEKLRETMQYAKIFITSYIYNNIIKSYSRHIRM